MEGYIEEVARAARKLGLETEADPRGGSQSVLAWGELEGRPVRVDAMWQGYREQSHVTMQCSLVPALDLGLTVKRTMLSLPFGITVDYPGFTDEHHVSADETSRARALLTAAVCKAITVVADLGGDIDLDDDRALVRQTLGFTEIAPTLYALTRVAAAIGESARALPAAGSLAEAARRWQDHAAREELTFRTTPLWMAGDHVVARTRRVGKERHHADVSLRLSEPLETGVALRPARRLELLWEIFAGKDVQVGDAPFDRAFTIAARDPALAGVVFDEPVRERIMTLHKLGDVHLGDQGIALHTKQVEEVPGALGVMRSIMERAWQNARDAVRRGPYR